MMGFVSVPFSVNKFLGYLNVSMPFHIKLIQNFSLEHETKSSIQKRAL